MVTSLAEFVRNKEDGSVATRGVVASEWHTHFTGNHPEVVQQREELLAPLRQQHTALLQQETQAIPRAKPRKPR